MLIKAIQYLYMSILLFLILRLYFNIEFTFKKYIYFGLYVILMILIDIYMYVPYNLILHAINIFILFFAVLDFAFLKSLMFFAITYTILFCGEYLSAYILINIFGLTMNEVHSNMLYTNIMYVLFIAIIIIIIAGKYFVKKCFIEKHKNKRIKQNTIVLSIYFLLTLIFFSIYMYISYKLNLYYNKDVMYLSLLFMFLFLGLNLLVIYFYKNSISQDIKIAQKQKEIKQLNLYTDIIEGLVKELRKERHNYNNILFSLYEYIKNENYDKLKTYFFTKIYNQNIQETNSIFLNLNNLKNISLKGLITTKINIALMKDLNVSLSLFQEIFIKNIEDIDLCKIVGELLDNAIEESSKTEEKILSIGLLKDSKSIIIAISNSFLNKPILSEIYKEGYTTKKSGGGYGLSNIKDILEKYPEQISLNTLIHEDLFVQELIISH